jgi:hypothetical protein
MIDKTFEPDNLSIEQMLPTKRAAKAAGHFAYFTGKECAYGHTSPRYAANGQCIECSRVLPVPRPLGKRIQKVATEEEKREKKRHIIWRIETDSGLIVGNTGKIIKKN